MVLKQFNYVYQQFHNKVSEDDLYHLISICKTLDIIHCKKEIAIKNNYSKPVIDIKEHSFLNIKELRHPLIEKVGRGPKVRPFLFIQILSRFHPDFI